MADDPPQSPNDLALRPGVDHGAPTPRSEGPSEGAESPIGGDGADLESAAESEIWSGRTHWKHYAGRLSLWLLANVSLVILIAWAAARFEWLTGGVAFGITLVVALVSAALILGRVALVILGHRYRLTSQRLFIVRGLLSQTVDQTELIRVDDVRLHKTVIDRIFGLGSVQILSTDATDREVRIEGIADPETVAEAIRSNMRILRRKSLFIENL
ncbi:MAG: PH domain-containing protein [Planctomycetes bacterium]|nr:PH domain-containing protein [Planctomycetota bacterium]